MKKKSDNDNLVRRKVVAVSLETGDVREFPSLGSSAAAIEASPDWLRRHVDRIKPLKGYVWADPENIDKAKAEASRLRFEGFVPRKPGCPRKTAGLVWLQLDSHTRIRVRPEEATPEFADNYRHRLNQARNNDPFGTDTNE